jgi:NitT/TauT family transport system substrate-binding protein
LRLTGRVLAGVFFLSAATAALLFYSFRERPPEPRGLLIYAPAPQVELLPVYLGVALGSFETAGLDLHVVYAAEEKPTRKQPALNAWQLEDVIYARTLGNESSVVVWILTQQEYAVLLGREPEPFAWEKTCRKSIITAEPTSATTAILEELLRQNNVYPHREATLMQNIPPELRIPVFLAGTGSYLVAPEPAATLLVQKKQAFPAAPLTLDAPVPRTVLAAPEGEARSNRAVIKAFNQVLAGACNHLYARPAGEIAWVVGPCFPHLSLPTLEKVIARGQQERIWSTDGKADPAHFNRLQEILKRAGELPRPLACEEVFWGQKSEAGSQKSEIE